MPIKVRSGGAWVQVAGDGADGQDGAGGDSIPAGTIVMYNGDTAPTGWALCDGGGGRPDLRDKFIIGSGSTYNRGDQGGDKDAVLISHTHGAGTYSTSNDTHNHSHTRLNSQTSYTQGVPVGSGGSAGSGFGTQTTGNDTHNHTVTGSSQSFGVNESGTTKTDGSVSGTNKNLPPYYAITFIIKT